MKTAKGFTLIEVMIVVAVIAILAMIAVSSYTRYIEHAKDTAAHSLLQHLALSELTLKTHIDEGESFIGVSGTGADAAMAIKRLGQYGFRPDPMVGFAAIEHITSEGDFILFAAHRSVGAPIYIYDFIPRAGVHPFDPAAAYAALLPTELIVYTWTVSGMPTAVGSLAVDSSTGRVSAYTPF